MFFQSVLATENTIEEPCLTKSPCRGCRDFEVVERGKITRRKDRVSKDLLKMKSIRRHQKSFEEKLLEEFLQDVRAQQRYQKRMQRHWEKKKAVARGLAEWYEERSLAFQPSELEFWDYLEEAQVELDYWEPTWLINLDDCFVPQPSSYYN